MKQTALAANLAASLASEAWHLQAIERCLCRRLPPELHAEAVILAREVSLRHPSAPAPTRKVLSRTLQTTTSFESIFDHCRRTDVWPGPDVQPPRMVPVPAFAGLDLPPLETPADLEDWLMLPAGRLDYMADATGRHEAHGETAINHYFYHVGRKRSGGSRLIEAPKPVLKALQRRILRAILEPVPVHRDAFGFVPGRSCLQAAARHAGEAMVITFDIRDFFSSVSAGRVFGVFRCLGYPEAVARALTDLCTNRTPARVRARLVTTDPGPLAHPHLPQGAPTSPVLANLACFGLDRRLSGLARSLGARYSRYADDLMFSGDADIARTLCAAVPGICAEEGLPLNPAKTRAMPSSARQMLTGMVVNRHCNITRRSFDTLKAVIHAAARPEDGRLAQPGFQAQLAGQIAWVEAVNPARGARLRRKFDAALEGHPRS